MLYSFQNKFKIIIFINFLLFNNVFANSRIIGDMPYLGITEGREHELKNIFDSLNSNREDSNIIFLSGLSGVGKSHIARTFISNHKEFYDVIMWINASQPMFEQLENILGVLNIIPVKQNINFTALDEESHIEGRFFDFLRKTKCKTLIILDDYKTNVKFNLGLSLPENVHIIFTSQELHPEFKTITIEPLNEKSADNLLMKYSEEFNPVLARKICSLIWNHPLAIKMAALDIKQTPSLSFENYLKLIDKEDNDMFVGQLKEVKKTILRTIQRVKKKSEKAYDLLLFCAFLDTEGISHSLILSWFHEKNNDNLMELHENIKILYKYNILYSIDTRFEESDEKRYKVHDLIREVILESISQEKKKEISERGALKIKPFFMEGYKDSLKNSTKIVSKHIISLSLHAIESKVKSRELYELLIDMVEHFLITERDYSFSKKYLSIIESHFSQCKYDDLKMKFFMNLAASNMTMSDYLSSISNANVALNIYNKSNNDSLYTSFLQSSAYYASSKAFVGEISEAKKIYYDLDISIKKCGYGGDKLNWPGFVNNVLHEKIKFDYLLEEGNYLDANKQMDFILNIIDNFVVNQTEPVDRKIFLFFDVHKNLVSTLLSSGNQLHDMYEKNSKLWKECLEFDKKSNQDNVYATALINLAISNFKLKNLDKAETQIKEAINILNTWIGESNVTREQAFAKLILAEINLKKKKYIDAMHILSDVDKIYSYVLRQKKIVNVNILYSLLIEISKKTGNDVTLTYFSQLFKETFGDLQYRYL